LFSGIRSGKKIPQSVKKIFLSHSYIPSLFPSESSDGAETRPFPLRPWETNPLGILPTYLDIEKAANKMATRGGSSGRLSQWQLWPQDIRLCPNTLPSEWFDLTDR
jgi:hypothetical protein